MEKYNIRNMSGIQIKFRREILCLILIFCTLAANANRDHLRPVPPLCFGGYEEAVLTSLISEQDPRLWMVVFPRKESQYAVILNERTEYDENDEMKERKWVLEYSRLKQKIPVKKLSASDIHALIHSRELEQYHLVVTEEFSRKIEEAWLSVLRKTRYPDEPLLFGKTFVFYSRREGFGGHYGLISSPKNGPPAMLVELGLKLGSLAKSEEKDREGIQKQCLEIASNIVQESEN